MKAIAGFIAAAVCITSPISAASAQVSQQQCRDNCQEEFAPQYEYCRSLGQSLDGEYCYLDVQTRSNACYSACEEQGETIASLQMDSTRFRPVQIVALDRPAI